MSRSRDLRTGHRLQALLDHCAHLVRTEIDYHRPAAVLYEHDAEVARFSGSDREVGDVVARCAGAGRHASGVAIESPLDWA